MNLSINEGTNVTQSFETSVLSVTGPWFLVPDRCTCLAIPKSWRQFTRGCVKPNVEGKAATYECRRRGIHSRLVFYDADEAHEALRVELVSSLCRCAVLSIYFYEDSDMRVQKHTQIDDLFFYIVNI